MAKKIEEKQSKIKSVISFPNKINTIGIIIIIIGYLMVSAFIISCANNNVDYTVYPDIEGCQFNEKLNTYVRLYSKYSLNDEDELEKRDYLILYCYAEKKYEVVNLSGRLSSQGVDGKMYYHTEKVPSGTDGIVSNHSSYIVNGSKLESNIKTLYGEYSYQYKENNEVKNVETEFKENIIKLTSKDKKETANQNFSIPTFEYTNGDIVSNEKLFTKFKVEVTEKDELYTINLNYTVASILKGQYHLDIQMILESEGKYYNLAGYYNLSNNVAHNYASSGEFPVEKEIKHIYVKGTIIDMNGVSHNFLYKAKFTDLK